MNPVLQLDQVVFDYQPIRKQGEKTPILDGVSLSVAPGERVGIIGDNGCGKSTLAKLFLGIFKPHRGNVFCFGKQASWATHLPQLGYIGDPGHNAEQLGLPAEVTVDRVLRLINRLEGNPAGQREEVKKRLGLDRLENRLIANLSTGERKRLMAGLTYLRKPRVLILDEPTTGLDKHIKPEVLNLIEEMTALPEVAVLFISHDRPEIDRFTERLFLLSNGQLAPAPSPRFRATAHRDGQQEIAVGKLGQMQEHFAGWLQDVQENPQTALHLQIQAI